MADEKRDPKKTHQQRQQEQDAEREAARAKIAADEAKRAEASAGKTPGMATPQQPMPKPGSQQ